MSDPAPAPQPPPSTRAASWPLRLLFLSPLIVTAVIIAIVMSSCIPARSAATRFLTALHDGRIDDARAFATPPILLHLVLETPIATPAIDPPRTIAFIRAATKVEIDGIVQAGFNDDFALFDCFDAKLDDAAVFWIVMRKIDGAWLVEALASEQPEVCKGSD